MQVQTTSKTFEVNQICQCGISQTSYYIVTRISKSNVWFKAISSIIIDDELSRSYGNQKWHSLPNFKVIDGKNVPIKTGKEFEILHVNDLDELCMACPAIVDGKLLIRTAGAVYCISNSVD